MTPAPHRGQALRLRQGVTLIDDSYNSNPVAVDAAITSLELAALGRRVAFLGDMLELGKDSVRLHEETGARIAPHLQALVGVGSLSAALVKGAGKAGMQTSGLHWFPDAAQAAEAVNLVEPGDAVLVKGSRGMRMEQVVDALVARFGILEA
jgi:UDP-N-acetylmuramoyl-tripeptide--D-alanyl-D-alanine ligase